MSTNIPAHTATAMEILRKLKTSATGKSHPSPTPGPQFYYTDIAGKRITDPVILRYIENLRPPIPPAYRDVKIFYAKDPTQLQRLYEGIDAAGRKQQIYSPTWNAAAYKAKFEELIRFGEQLPSLQKRIMRYSRSPQLSRDKMISIMLRLINECHFRIGHPKYERKYGSYGVSTLQVRHVKELASKSLSARSAAAVKVSFRGKKGVQNECKVVNPEIAGLLLQLTKGKKNDEYVFLEDGKLVTPEKVNRWLESQIKGTTKMFRTFDTNTLLIEFLRNKTQSKPATEFTAQERGKHITEAMKDISEEINNTPAILKKNYASRELIELYVQEPEAFDHLVRNDQSPHEVFVGFLKDIFVS